MMGNVFNSYTVVLLSSLADNIVSDTSDTVSVTLSDTSDFIQSSVARGTFADANEWLIKLISIAVTCLIAFLLYAVTHRIVRKFIIDSTDEKITGGHVTAATLIFNLLKVLLITFTVIVVLDIVGINITGFVAGLGIVGAIAGLAVQDILKDMIACANIASDKYFVIGDKIEVQGYKGEVISISIRSIKLKTYDGSIVTIQNHLVDKARVISDDNTVLVPLPYDYERAKAYDLMETIADKISKIDGVKNAYTSGIKGFEDSSILYVIKFLCEPDIAPRIEREANVIIIDELDMVGVEIPFKQVDIHQK